MNLSELGEKPFNYFWANIQYQRDPTKKKKKKKFLTFYGQLKGKN